MLKKGTTENLGLKIGREWTCVREIRNRRKILAEFLQHMEDTKYAEKTMESEDQDGGDWMDNGDKESTEVFDLREGKKDQKRKTCEWD